MPSSGPGSRGGQVIGTTRSGKPIYASSRDAGGGGGGGRRGPGQNLMAARAQYPSHPAQAAHDDLIRQVGERQRAMKPAHPSGPIASAGGAAYDRERASRRQQVGQDPRHTAYMRHETRPSASLPGALPPGVAKSKTFPAAQKQARAAVAAANLGPRDHARMAAEHRKLAAATSTERTDKFGLKGKTSHHHEAMAAAHAERAQPTGPIGGGGLPGRLGPSPSQQFSSTRETYSIGPSGRKIGRVAKADGPTPYAKLPPLRLRGNLDRPAVFNKPGYKPR